MAATTPHSLPWIDSRRNMTKRSISMRLSQRCWEQEQQRLHMLISSSLQARKVVTSDRPVTLKVSCSPQDCRGSYKCIVSSVFITRVMIFDVQKLDMEIRFDVSWNDVIIVHC